MCFSKCLSTALRASLRANSTSLNRESSIILRVTPTAIPHSLTATLSERILVCWYLGVLPSSICSIFIDGRPNVISMSPPVSVSHTFSKQTNNWNIGCSIIHECVFIINKDSLSCTACCCV